MFGLCRKKSAGCSVRQPLSGTSIFENQDEVNSFVDLQGHDKFSHSEVHNYTIYAYMFVCMYVYNYVFISMYILTL